MTMKRIIITKPEIPDVATHRAVCHGPGKISGFLFFQKGGSHKRSSPEESDTSPGAYPQHHQERRFTSWT